MRARHRATLSTIQSVAGVLIMFMAVVANFAAKHGALGEFSALAVVGSRILGTAAGLMAVMAIVSAIVALARSASMAERLYVAQSPRTDDQRNA
jgi:hypothetical protein